MEWFRAVWLVLVRLMKGFLCMVDPTAPEVTADPPVDIPPPLAVRETQRALDLSQAQLIQSATAYNDARRNRIAAQDAEQSRKRGFVEAQADRNLKLQQHAAAIQQSYPDPTIVDDTPAAA